MDHRKQLAQFLKFMESSQDTEQMTEEFDESCDHFRRQIEVSTCALYHESKFFITVRFVLSTS